MIQIDKNVPMPTRANARKNKLPFNIMEPGDSFIYKETASHKFMQSARSIVNHYNRKNGSAFDYAELDGKIRIWRIK